MLKREARLGEIFIAVSLLALLIGLTAMWNQDRRLKEREYAEDISRRAATKEREYADDIRLSAATVSAKVERWPELEDRFFEDLEPVLVDVSEKVAESHSTEPANRMLFKGLADAKGKSSQRWLDEQLELSYMQLHVRVPEGRSVFRGSIEALKNAEYKMYEELSISLQTVLRDDQVLKLKDSPDIGNILRAKTAEKRSAFLPHVREISGLLRQEMKAVIEMPASDLLDPKMRARTLVPL